MSLRRVLTIQTNLEDGNDSKGRFGGDAPKHLGGLQYVSTCTRPNLQQTIGSIARHIQSWSKLGDRKLHRVMCYSDCTKDHGIHLVGDATVGFYGMVVNGELDSDHGGDLRTAKSTSGAYAELNDSAYTAIPLAHESRLQPVAELSTGSAEYAALAIGMSEVLLPLQDLAEQMFRILVMLNVGVDNTAAEYTARSGYSKALRYMKKHHKIKTAFVQDSLQKRHKWRKVIRVASSKNRSDIQTKPLDRLKHETNRKAIHVIGYRSYLETLKG